MEQKTIKDVGFEYANFILHSEKYFHFFQNLITISFYDPDIRDDIYEHVVHYVISHRESRGRDLFNDKVEWNELVGKRNDMRPEVRYCCRRFICLVSEFLSIYCRYDGFILVKIDCRDIERDEPIQFYYEFRFFELIYFVNFIHFVIGKNFGTVEHSKFDCKGVIEIFNGLMSICNVNEDSSLFQRHLILTPFPLNSGFHVFEGLGTSIMLDSFLCSLANSFIDGCWPMRCLLGKKARFQMNYISIVGFGVSRKFTENSKMRYQIFIEFFQRLFTLEECAEMQKRIELGILQDQVNGITDNFRLRLALLPLEIFSKILNDAVTFITKDCACKKIKCSRSLHNNRCRKGRGIVNSNRNMIFPIKMEEFNDRFNFKFRKWRLVLTVSNHNIGAEMIRATQIQDVGCCYRNHLESSFDVYNACHLQLADEIVVGSYVQGKAPEYSVVNSRIDSSEMNDWFRIENKTKEIRHEEAEWLIECQQSSKFIPTILEQSDHTLIFD